TRLSCLLSLMIASSASAVTMAWTPIGNPGNPADTNSSHIGNANLCGTTNPCGVVPYGYSIGTYEVTNAQYAEFLNAKAVADPLGLYDYQMGVLDPTHYGWGGITRSGSDGSYTYSTISGRADMPVNYVSFYNALRF